VRMRRDLAELAATVVVFVIVLYEFVVKPFGVDLAAFAKGALIAVVATGVGMLVLFVRNPKAKGAVIAAVGAASLYFIIVVLTTMNPWIMVGFVLAAIPMIALLHATASRTAARRR